MVSGLSVLLHFAAVNCPLDEFADYYIASQIIELLIEQLWKYNNISWINEFIGILSNFSKLTLQPSFFKLKEKS